MAGIYRCCKSHELYFIVHALSDIWLPCLHRCILQLTRFDTYMNIHTHTKQNSDGKTFYKLPGHDRRLFTNMEKNYRWGLLEITQQDFSNQYFYSDSIPPTPILNSAWWPTPLEQSQRRAGDMLNTLSGMNNAGTDCKSAHAPGGVNKGDCSVLYFLFTHLCSARWRSDVVSLKPCGRVYVYSGMKLSGLD